MKRRNLLKILLGLVFVPAVAKSSVSKLEYPYVYIHSCGGEAFYANHMPVHGELAEADDVLKTDGTHPSNGDTITCGSCGKTVWPNEKNVVKR